MLELPAFRDRTDAPGRRDGWQAVEFEPEPVVVEAHPYSVDGAGGGCRDGRGRQSQR